jgi:phosphatidylglycerophosphatase A
MRRAVRKLAVTGLGTGYLPVMPGTWGSAGAAGAYLLAIRALGASAVPVAAAMAALAAVAGAACVAFGRFAEEAFGRKDPRQCVADEWAGQALAYLLLPLGTVWADHLVAAAVGLFYFRVMDILKPPPARRLERLPRGWGVLLDDLVAGLYANVAAQVSLRWCYFGS